MFCTLNVRTRISTYAIAHETNLPLLPPTLVFLPTHHRRRRTLALLLSIRRTQRSLLPKIQPNHILHTAAIMLNSAHIRQPRSSRPLGCALHNLDALYQRTVDFVPHLHAHAGKLAAQQNGGVDAAAPDVDTDAREGIAGALAYEEDVADACAFGVVFCEEAGSCAGGVEHSGVGGGYGSEGVGAGFLDVWFCGCEDGDTEVSAWSGILASAAQIMCFVVAIEIL
jgi:hypothetical protein